MVNQPRWLVNRSARAVIPLTQARIRVDWDVSQPYHRHMEYSGKASYAVGLVSTGRGLVQATRPKQWTKNLLVFMALFFTINEAWDASDLGEMLPLLAKTTLGFLIFCALSGAVYLANDVVDARRDRLHPTKRFRPIASGQLAVSTSLTTAAVLAAAGVASAFLVEPLFGGVATSYLATMTAYTLVLKQLIVLDVFAISAGFVLRTVAGAAVIQVPISPWLYLCTGLGALFIALAKRRCELASAGDRAASQRSTLEWYTQGLLDQLIAVVATSVVIAYSFYTFTAQNLPDNHTMMLTIPFVVYGVFRYTYLMRVKNAAESPEDVLTSDVPLIVTIVSWLATAATVLVMFRD